MKDNILKGASILTAMLMFSMLLSPVLAAPPQPNNRWGYASDGAGVLANGELITAWVDGVQYGDDLTVDGTGLFSVDTLGDEDYGLGTEKDGGVLGEFIYYVHGDLTTSGVFMTGVSVPEPWIVGGFEVFNEDLAEDAASPDLLKITSISIAPTPYIGIYDASGAATITDFALDINNGGAVQIAAGDIITTIGLITYIDPTSFGGISNDDALTLAEFGTGYIVDRVEFGTINVEPQETIMPNAGNPAAGMEIHRTPADGSDTNDCAVDFIPGVAVTFGDTITVGGPVSAWTNVAAVTITYVVAGAPVTFNLWYSTDGGATWIFIGNDGDGDGSYGWAIPADGVYDWYGSCANGFDPDPTGGEMPEAGTYDYDGTAPIVDAGMDHLIPTQAVPFLQDATVDASISGVLTYAWIQTAGPGVVNFVTADIEDPMVSADTNGVYTIQLTVTDNAGNSASDTTDFEWLVGGATTEWLLFNGRNYLTFTSTMTAGWWASDLLEDIVAQLNAEHGEDLTNDDLTCTQYTGSFNTCYWFMGVMWLNDFQLFEGDGYIVEILNDKLDAQPTDYELPNNGIQVTVTIDLFNGRNYIGFPITTTATMASEVLEELVAEINAAFGEDLTYDDVTLTQYTGSFNTCYWFMGVMWLNDFALDPQAGFILEIMNDKLDVQPTPFTP